MFPLGKARGMTMNRSDGKCHVWRHKISSTLNLVLSVRINRSTAVLISSGWFPFPLLVAILLFRRIFMTSHMTLSSGASKISVSHPENFRTWPPRRIPSRSRVWCPEQPVRLPVKTLKMNSVYVRGNIFWWFSSIKSRLQTNCSINAYFLFLFLFKKVR